MVRVIQESSTLKIITIAAGASNFCVGEYEWVWLAEKMFYSDLKKT